MKLDEIETSRHNEEENFQSQASCFNKNNSYDVLKPIRISKEE
jgi:hypothetical protein